MFEKGKRDRRVEVTVLETELINQRGELVVKSRTRLMER